MNGIILIDKPQGISSHDAVDFLRKEFGVRKIGHSGTLDPLATGLLVLGIGSATKSLSAISSSSKEYVAKIVLGKSTDTHDITGIVVTSKEDVNVLQEEFEKACKTFLGKIKQIPPMFSAKKVKGKRCYDLARKGITIERKPSDIEIFSLDILEFNGDSAILKINCSSGTYIRTLCHDIGDILGVGGTMAELCRTKIGKFNLENAISLENLKKMPVEEKIKRIIAC